MTINDITAFSEGKLSHPSLTTVEAGTIRFKVVYLTPDEIAQIRKGLDGQQWYGAMTEALRFTAKWPLHLQRLAPMGRLQAKIANVIIVEQ